MFPHHLVWEVALVLAIVSLIAAPTAFLLVALDRPEKQRPSKTLNPSKRETGKMIDEAITRLELQEALARAERRVQQFYELHESAVRTIQELRTEIDRAETERNQLRAGLADAISRTTDCAEHAMHDHRELLDSGAK